MGRDYSRLPELPNFRSEISMGLFDIEIRGQILTLVGKTNVSNMEIADMIHSQHVYTSDEHAAERGVEAMKVAGAIRKRYKLPKMVDSDYLVAIEALVKKRAEVLGHREQNKILVEKFHAALEPYATTAPLNRRRE